MLMVTRNVKVPVRQIKPQVTVRKVKAYANLKLGGVECNILKDNPIPSYKNKYDMVPHFYKKNNDEFICAASFTEKAMEDYLAGNVNSDNFKNGLLRRIDSNMVPYFFVYESDSLSLEEQLKNIDKILSGPAKNCITSVTFSGSKSIHILVKIPEKYREDIKKDYKYYWDLVAQFIFQDKVGCLDKACASISRLTRQPNGDRENGVKQICYYYNKDACLLESQFEFSVPEHNAFLEKKAKEDAIKEYQRQLKYQELQKTPENDLKKMRHFAKANPKWEVVFEVLDGDTSSRENSEYLTALGMLKTAEISDEIIYEYVSKCKHDYPKFWPKSINEYLR